jgi:hypothetical protein
VGLDTVEFVMSVEKEFGIEVPDADAERLLTPGAVVSYLMTRRADLPRAEIEGTIRRLMEDELGITEFGWDQEFVKDLGVD